MKTQPQSPCPEQHLQQIYHNIERTILDLQQNPIQYGMFFFGIVQAGITTSCHYLTNVALRGAYDDNKNLVYKLGDPAGKARIGSFQGRTQTSTINFFKTSIKNPHHQDTNPKQALPEEQAENQYSFIQQESQYQNENQQQNYLYLIDCPGAMNSEWLHRYFRNHIYHYLIFSKIQNLKFVITFSFGDMAKTAHLMLQTFSQFFKMFKSINEEQDRKKLISSICVLVTNVPNNLTVKDLLARFKKTPDIEEYFQSIYLELKEHIIKHELLFIFHSPTELKKPCEVLNTTLKKINNKTMFWRRNIEQNGLISLKNISDSFPIFTQYNRKDCNNCLNVLREFYGNVVKKRMLDFYEIIAELVKDCKDGNSANFLSKMIEKGKQYYLQKVKNYPKYLSKTFTQKRNKLRQTIFKEFPLSFKETDIKLAKSLLMELNKVQSYGRIVEFAGQFKGFQHPRQLRQVMTKTLAILMTLAKMYRQNQTNQDSGLKQVQIFIYQIWIKMAITSMWSEHCQQIFGGFKQNAKFFYYDYSLYQHRASIRDIILKSVHYSFEQIMLACMQKNKLPPYEWASIIAHLVKFRSQLTEQSQQTKLQDAEKKCLAEVVGKMALKMKEGIAN